jgi:hypothetical protein
MTGGKRPLAGIGEAQRKAVSWGFVVTGVVTEAPSPFDFTVHDKGSISLVRVRRLKHHGYRTELILRSCAEQIREFRELAEPTGILRELWVRGPERAWHRYRVLPETIEEVKDLPHLASPMNGTSGTEEDPGISDPEYSG